MLYGTIIYFMFVPQPLKFAFRLTKLDLQGLDSLARISPSICSPSSPNARCSKSQRTDMRCSAPRSRDRLRGQACLRTDLLFPSSFPLATSSSSCPSGSLGLVGSGELLPYSRNRVLTEFFPQPLLLRFPLDRHSSATGSNLRLRRNHRSSSERLRRRCRPRRSSVPTPSAGLRLSSRPVRVRLRYSSPRHRRSPLLQARRSQARCETIAFEEHSDGRWNYEGEVTRTETRSSRSSGQSTESRRHAKVNSRSNGGEDDSSGYIVRLSSGGSELYYGSEWSGQE